MPLTPPPRTSKRIFSRSVLRQRRPQLTDNATISSFFPAITAFSIIPATGTYALTDENERLLKASKDTTQTGTYSLSGENETLLKASKDTVQTGTYALTGENETLLKASLQHAQAGFYTTSSGVKLLKASLAVVQTAFYNMTDEQVALLRAAKAIAQTGFYTLTDEQLKLTVAHLLAVQSVFYTLTGESLGLTVAAFGVTIFIGAGFYGLNSSWPSKGLLNRWPLDSAHLSSGVDSDTFGANVITESGTVTSATGPSGSANGARSFDGNSGYGSFASSPLPSSGAYTVLMWANPTDITAHVITGVNLTLINLGTNGSGNNQLRLTLDNGDTNIAGGYAWWAIPSANAGTATAVFADGVWAQFGLTFDGTSTYQTVFNGAVITTTAPGPNPPSASNQIASRNAASPFYPGGLARLTIYNRVLSAAELAQAYNAELGGPGATEQLTLLKASLLKAQETPYSLTDENVRLTRASLLAPQAGLYTQTDENLGLLRASLSKAQSGFYNLTDETLALLRGSLSKAQSGFYSLAGENLGLRATHLLFPQMTPFALTGESLILTIPAAGFVMSIGSGAYALTGESLTLLKASKQGLQVGVYSLTDEALTALKSSRLVGTTGSYSLIGNALRLTAVLPPTFIVKDNTPQLFAIYVPNPNVEGEA